VDRLSRASHARGAALGDHAARGRAIALGTGVRLQLAVSAFGNVTPEAAGGLVSSSDVTVRRDVPYARCVPNGRL
jgi:hypothetical protein